ncbi:MAG: site-2 protease family protein [Candidatus Pacebacteria bacterium]|nr:site-2 protease family protein [Candidatus Paceibacterota bacterium]
MQRSKTGFLVLLVKLGPKLFPILVKMQEVLITAVKSLFGVKTVGLVGSVGLYTYLFTWQMAVALVAFIGIHEYGHLWAMHRCGIKTKGMFFIPGFGAVAVAEERFGSARNEAYIAIMGPIFGFVFFVIPMVIVFLQTRNPLWAAIAAITAFINLVNLFPILPLDGGRILKALSYSKNQGISLTILVVVSSVSVILGTYAGFSLLAYMAVIGMFEAAIDFGIRERIKSFLTTAVRIAIAVGIVLLCQYFLSEFGKYWEDAKGHSSVYWLLFIGAGVLGAAAFIIYDIKSQTYDEGRSIFLYPVAVCQELWRGIKEVASLRAHDIKPIENYEPLSRGGKTWYALVFTSVTIVHMIVIYELARIPGAELAKELLK